MHGREGDKCEGYSNDLQHPNPKLPKQEMLEEAKVG